METRFYTGNYLLPFGHPYVIISAEERQDVFFAETFVLFQTITDQPILKPYKIRYPKVGNLTLNDFLFYEIDQSKNIIVYDIIYERFREVLEQRYTNIIIDLRESNQTILSVLKDKFPLQLNLIRHHTVNQYLRDMIQLYQSIIIERDDFEV